MGICGYRAPSLDPATCGRPLGHAGFHATTPLESDSMAQPISERTARELIATLREHTRVMERFVHEQTMQNRYGGNR